MWKSKLNKPPIPTPMVKELDSDDAWDEFMTLSRPAELDEYVEVMVKEEFAFFQNVN